MALRRCLRRPLRLRPGSDGPIMSLLSPLPRALVRLLSSDANGEATGDEEAMAATLRLDPASAVGEEGSHPSLEAAIHDVQTRRRDHQGSSRRGGQRGRGAVVLTGPERVETLNHFWKELTKACNEKNLEGAFEILDKMFGLTLHPPLYLVRRVMRLCVLSARWDMALDLLERHHQHSEREAGADARLYTMAIDACRRAGRVDEAVGVLASMKARCVAPDGAAYTMVIQACGRARDWQRAVDLLGQAISELGAAAIDTRTYNAALSACARGGAGKEVQRLVGVMEAAGVAWDRHTYRAVIDSWSRARRPDKALQLLERMKASGDEALLPDVGMYNMVMAACLKRGWPGRTLQLLQRMRDGGLRPDSYSYVAAITACGAMRKASSAVKGAVLDLLQEMNKHTPPGRLAYSAAIHACARAGEWQAALSLLEEMVDRDYVPEFWSYAAATEACGSGGPWKQTLSLLHSTTTGAKTAGQQQQQQQQAEHEGVVDYYNSVLLSACQGGEEPCRTTLELVERMLAGRRQEAGAEGAGELDLWKAVVTCQQAGRWRRLASLALRSSKGRRRPKGVSVQLQCVTVLAGLRLGLLEEAVRLFMKLEEEAWGEHEQDEEEAGGAGALAVDMVYHALVRAAVKREGGWQAVLQALQESESRGLASHKLALEACCRSEQWQKLLPIVEPYGRRGKEEQVLYDFAVAVLEEMGALRPVSPEVAAAVWARERREMDEGDAGRATTPGGGAAGPGMVPAHVDRGGMMQDVTAAVTV